MFPAVALAEGLTIEQPSGLVASPVTFSGATNGTINGVTLMIESNGSPYAEPVVSMNEGHWSAVQSLPPGEYTVTASEENISEPDIAGPVSFTVGEPPGVSVTPVTSTVEAGETATFHATTSGSPAPGVSWEVSQDGGSTWSKDTTDTASGNDLRVVGTLGRNGFQYRAVAKNPLGGATSNAATLEVGEAPGVSVTPTTASVKEGETATFYVTAWGSPTPEVSWQVSQDGGNTWNADTTDAMSGNGLKVAATLGDNGFKYRAVAKNSFGKRESNAATLEVQQLPPTVKVSPEDPQVHAGESVKLETTVAGNPTSYEWAYSPNGKEVKSIPGATSPTYTIANVRLSQSNYWYGVRVRNSNPTTVERWVQLKVLPSPPVVSTNPSPTVVALGYQATFTAAAETPQAPTVQWEESRDNKTWTKVPGATEPTLTTAPQAKEGEFLYRARFTNESGVATTNPAVLTVTTPTEPHVTVPPQSTTVASGGTASFFSAAAGPPEPTVQWEESSDGGTTWTAVPNASSDELTISGVSVAQTGHEYRALFTNGVGSGVTSVPATLTVTPPPPQPSPGTSSALPGLVPGFSVFPATPHVGETVTLASTSTDAASPITGFAWDFAGNGSYVAGSSLATTSFATSGAHLVHLRAAAADGATREVGETINVLPRQLSLIQPFPIVRMVGSLAAAGVRVSLLTVQAPAGSLVSARCVGKHCPLKLERVYALARAGSTRVAPVTLWRFERFLRSGVVLQIKVSKAGQIGKYTSFTVRRGKVPVRVDECLDPNLLTPMVCPSS